MANADPVFTRTLIIKANDLGAAATLMLTFDKDIKGLYNDNFPLCWKVTSFGKEGGYTMRATFKSQLGFVKPQVESDIIVGASTYKILDVGQKTTLTKDDRGVYHFSDPVPGEDGYLKAVNGCPLREDMALGFPLTPGAEPTPVLYFNKIGHEASIIAQFTPVLRAYITEQYQETQILRGEVSTPSFWEQDLADLDETTNWRLELNKSSGVYKLVQV